MADIATRARSPTSIASHGTGSLKEEKSSQKEKEKIIRRFPYGGKCAHL